MKHYFETIDSELCFNRDYFIDIMKSKKLKQIEVYTAEIEYNVTYFWCSKLSECGEVGVGCGVDCEHYKPRNKKNGRCRFSNNCYSVGEKTTLKIRTMKPKTKSEQVVNYLLQGNSLKLK